MQQSINVFSFSCLYLSQNLFSIKSSFSPAARFPTGVKILVARSEMIAVGKAGILPMEDDKFANCWKFLPDHKIERGWWDDEYGIGRNIVFGGCGTDMPYGEARDNINRIQWNIDAQYNVLSFDGYVLKITKINHDTIYFKNRYGTRILLINWGENVKKVKKEMPFNEKDTITLQDPFNDKALSQ